MFREHKLSECWDCKFERYCKSDRFLYDCKRFERRENVNSMRSLRNADGKQQSQTTHLPNMQYRD